MPRPRTFRPALIGVCLLCCGCAASPSSRGAAMATDPFPQLLPIDSLLAAADVAPADPAPGIAARAARLKARAATLGAP